MKRVAIGFGLLVLTAGSTSFARQAELFPQTPRPSDGVPTCSIPGKGRFSFGAVQRVGNDVYRCYFVYGSDLAAQPTGVAWLKVEFLPDGRAIPRDGR